MLRLAVRVRRSDAEVVLANLLRPLLLAWSLSMNGTAHRWIIASGLLEPEAQTISQAFAAQGYREANRLVRGDWAALLMEAPDHR